MYPIIPGQWYLRYTCKRCKAKEVIFPDLSRGRAKIDATYVISCPDCRNKAAYDPLEIERYQHPIVQYPIVLIKAV
jgi:DNA-directed RNA polymerase subunit RPC12/RpoP